MCAGRKTVPLSDTMDAGVYCDSHWIDICATAFTLAEVDPVAERFHISTERILTASSTLPVLVESTPTLRRLSKYPRMIVKLVLLPTLIKRYRLENLTVEEYGGGDPEDVDRL